MTYRAIAPTPGYYSLGSLIVPPTAASYTVIGDVTLYDTVSAYGYGVRAGLFTNSNSIGNVALKASSAISSTTIWAVTLTCSVHVPPISFPEIGVLVADGNVDNSNGYTLAAWSQAGGLGLHVENIKTGAHARVSNNNEVAGTFEMSQLFTGDGVMHFRILSDGTNLHYQTSTEGFHWNDWYTAATPAGLGYFGFQLGNDFTSSNAYCEAMIYDNQVTIPSSWSITNATNANPIVVTTSTANTLQDGDLVAIHGVTGNTNANTGTGNNWNSGTYQVHPTSSTQFQLVGVSGNGTFGGSPTVVLASR
jgi:hypothetical protein